MREDCVTAGFIPLPPPPESILLAGGQAREIPQKDVGGERAEGRKALGTALDQEWSEGGAIEERGSQTDTEWEEHARRTHGIFS